ncbi:MAG: hypothetical protein ACXVXN_00585 [Mycobacteriaceae bacterium]
MTLALADQSSLPPLAGWEMVVAVILGLAAIAILFCGPLVHRAPLQDNDTSGLDALDGLSDQRKPGEAFCSDCPDHEACAIGYPCHVVQAAHGLNEGQPACHSTGPRGGHYVRATGNWWVCEACGQTWARGDAPYDQEAPS